MRLPVLHGPVLALAAAALFGATIAGAQDADLQAQIEDLQQRYEQAWTGGDTDTLVELHTEDALMWPSTGGSFEGHDAIRGWFEEAPQPVTFDIQSERTERLGEFIVDTGTFSGTMPDEAGGKAIEGEYLVISQESDGELRLHRLFASPPREGPPGIAQ